MADQPIIIKRRKNKHHGHHGGAWKVAYADFITAMMAFFMVMWIMGLSEEDRAIIQGYFNDPAGFEKSTPQGRPSLFTQMETQIKQSQDERAKEADAEQERAEQLYEEISEGIEADPELSKMLQSSQLQVRVTSAGIQIDIIENESNGEVFFKLGSAEVRPAARELVGKIGPLLASSGRKMVIEGHTDSRPYPGIGYDNFDLSNDRAQAVRRLLLGAGVATSQVMEVRALADTQPRLAADTRHFSNRRVTVLLPYQFEAKGVIEMPKLDMRETIEGQFRVPLPTESR